MMGLLDFKHRKESRGKGEEYFFPWQMHGKKLLTEGHSQTVLINPQADKV